MKRFGGLRGCSRVSKWVFASGKRINLLEISSTKNKIKKEKEVKLGKT